MGFTEAISSGYQNYANFSGRSQRSAYWWWTLYIILASLVLGLIDRALGLGSAEYGVGLLGGVWSLAHLIPGISVGVRRLHDTDRSGWWYLLIFVPIVGAIVLIVFFATRGTAGQNRFGPDPLA